MLKYNFGINEMIIYSQYIYISMLVGILCKKILTVDLENVNIWEIIVYAR